MDIEKEREKIAGFIKAGLFGLSFVMLVGCAVMYIPKAVSVFVETDKTANLKPIQSVECKEKRIALSFDVAGSRKKLEDILDVLNKQQIKASFFVTGEWVEKNPDMIQKLYVQGHDIGNHSQSHKEMNFLTKEECEEEIRLVHDKVKTLTGVNMNLFRVPYQEVKEEVFQAAQDLGYYLIGWNINSLDWKDYGVDPIINEICNNSQLKEGSIILCHTNTRFTREALDKVITTLKRRGYSFEKVSELIYTTQYHVNKEGRQVKNVNNPFNL